MQNCEQAGPNTENIVQLAEAGVNLPEIYAGNPQPFPPFSLPFSSLYGLRKFGGNRGTFTRSPGSQTGYKLC
jgi:hypothetical protein